MSLISLVPFESIPSKWWRLCTGMNWFTSFVQPFETAISLCHVTPLRAFCRENTRKTLTAIPQMSTGLEYHVPSPKTHWKLSQEDLWNKLCNNKHCLTDGSKKWDALFLFVLLCFLKCVVVLTSFFWPVCGEVFVPSCCRIFLLWGCLLRFVVSLLSLVGVCAGGCVFLFVFGTSGQLS